MLYCRPSNKSADMELKDGVEDSIDIQWLVNIDQKSYVWSGPIVVQWHLLMSHAMSRVNGH